jgi:hypothetical protein
VIGPQDRQITLFAAVFAVAFLSATPIARGQAESAPGPLAEMIVNADAQDGAAFLSWSTVPGATIALRWREVGSADWVVRGPTPSNFDMVDGLKNGLLYEFQPVLSVDGTHKLGPRIQLSPQERKDCDFGSHVYCTQDRLISGLRQSGITSTELFCAGRAIETTSVMPNCRYTWGGVAFGLNRAYGSRFVPPLMRPRQELARSVLARAVWGMDFDSAKKQFAPAIYESSLPFPSKIDGQAEVRTYIAQITPSLLSRISWYTPERAIPNLIVVRGRHHQLAPREPVERDRDGHAVRGRKRSRPLD